MEKKLNLETKIRDAARSLSQANSAHKTISKQTEEQLDIAEQRIAAAQMEYWRVSGRTSDVQSRLLQHYAGVLGYTVQEMDKRVNHFNTQPVGQLGSNDIIPNCSITSGSQANGATSSKVTFSGLHFFAGHANAQVPKSSPSPSEVVTLEANLHAATQSLNAANDENARMAEELQLLRLEKEQAGWMMDAERQRTGERVAALEKELLGFGELETKHNQLLKEQMVWNDQRAELEARGCEVERLEERLVILEEKCGETAEMERVLAEVRQAADAKVQQREGEVSALNIQLTEAQEKWEADKKLIEENQFAEVCALQEELKTLQTSVTTQPELDEVVDMMSTLMQHHEVQHSPDDTSLHGMLASLEAHLQNLSEILDDHTKAREEWEFAHESLESQLHARTEECEVTSAELGVVRQKLEEAKREALELASPIKVSGSPLIISQDVAHALYLGPRFTICAQWPSYRIQR